MDISSSPPILLAGGNSMRIRIIKSIIIGIIICIITACQSKVQKENYQIPLSGSLTVMYFDEQSFMDDFGKLFQLVYPNIEFNVIEYPSDNLSELKWDEWINRNRPDLMVVDRHMYQSLSKENLLLNLEQKMQTSIETKPDGIVAPVLEMLKSDGMGSIQGLGPFFHSRVLYYNKNLFDKYNVEYPTDNMSWDEVFNRASSFINNGASEDNVVGLYHPFMLENLNPFSLVNIAAKSENIGLFDHDLGRNRIKNSRIEHYFRQVIGGMKAGSIYNPVEDEKNFDLFASGLAAMRYEGYFYLRKLDQSNISWQMVNEPSANGYTPNFFMKDIFVIPKIAANQNIAWEFIKYVHSESFQRIKLRSPSRFGVSSLKSILSISEQSNQSFNVFAKLKPLPLDMIVGEDMIDINDVKVQSVVRQGSLDALLGKQSIDNAIDWMENNITTQ